MEVAITKMSQNGQIVIPAEIREDAGIKPSTKFMVFNEGGIIFLKKIDKKALAEEMKLVKEVQESEEQIKRGECVVANTDMSPKELDNLLMKK